MRYVRIVLFLVLAAALVPSCSADNRGDLQVKKDQEIQQVKPKKPIKIKLRRSPRDEYTWELSGDDPDEIVKTDRKLRKMLNVQ